MKNKLILVVAIVLIVVLGAGFLFSRTNSAPSQEENVNKLQVAASFYPLYFFAQEIGGDQVTVTNLTPAGAEPHDFEPNARDIAQLETMSLLLVNGAGFEPWLDQVEDNLQGKNTRVVRVAEDLVSLEVEHEGERETDPHVWLDPVLAQQQVQLINLALIEVDPMNQSTYEQNSQELIQRLAALDSEFSQGLSQCRQRHIVTSHQAFGYLAARYGLEQVAITGISPDQEPSPTDIAAVADFAEQNQVKYIFFETLVSHSLAETIAQEVGAQTLVFDPLEGLSAQDVAAGRDYFSVQRENLRNLQLALECK